MNSSSRFHEENQEPKQATKPQDLTPKTHDGAPRPLGSQTNLGDQEELEGVRDPFMDEEEKTAQEHEEERAQSNTTTHYASRKTRAGERDPFGSQGQW